MNTPTFEPGTCDCGIAALRALAPTVPGAALALDYYLARPFHERRRASLEDDGAAWAAALADRFGAVTAPPTPRRAHIGAYCLPGMDRFGLCWSTGAAWLALGQRGVVRIRATRVHKAWEFC